MITGYIQAALRRATYELEDAVYYAEIPGFDGVVAYGDTLEECREQLIEVLEGWLIISIRHGHQIPVVDGMDLNPIVEAA